MDEFWRWMDFIWKLTASVGLPVIAWMIRQIFVLRRDLDAQAHQHDTLCQTTVQLRERVDGLPGVGGLHELASVIQGQAGDLKAIREVMTRLERVVERHENYLLGRGER